MAAKKGDNLYFFFLFLLLVRNLRSRMEKDKNPEFRIKFRIRNTAEHAIPVVFYMKVEKNVF